MSVRLVSLRLMSDPANIPYADPVVTLRSLAAFAELTEPSVDFIQDGVASLGPCHSAAGNPMRFAVGRIPLQRDDAWVRSLPDRQRRLVGAVCAPLLRAYGYPIATSSNQKETR